jgi:anaerobic dimethyl sulfoxide reductase subunit B (iron-sulfur subunit)
MACVVACQDQNDLDAIDVVAFRHVTTSETGAYPSARIDHFSLACQHCGDAPCVVACPTAAIRRRGQDNVVVVDRDLCVGCHTCQLTCPFGAPTFPEDGRMAKCDVGPIEELSARKAKEASLKILKSIVASSSGDV